MNQNALSILLRAQIIAGLTRQGKSWPVVASFQPTTQGRNTAATVYFHPLPDRRYGWQGRKREYKPLENEIITQEKQWIESSYQVYALAPSNPSDLTMPTAIDILNTVAMICNSEPFVTGMRKCGAGIQRITEIRNPYFVNDQGQFEASPSFDITISHQRIITEVTPVAEAVTVSIHRV